MAPTTREGPFHGTHHLALLAHLSHSSASGILEVKARPRTALITYLQGHITWVETNDPATNAGQVLRDAGMLGTEQLRTLEADAPDEDSLMERIAEALGRTRRDLEPWRLAAVRARLAAGVGWGSGSWRFVETAEASLRGIDERMLPQIDLVRVGWEAVLAWVDDERARREVLDPTAGPLLPGPQLDYALTQLRLPPALAPLRERIHARTEPASLLAELGDRSPELVRILWLLEFGGWAVRRDRKTPWLEKARADEAPPTVVKPTTVKSSNTDVERVLGLWESRSDRDLYDLLGVRPYASTATIARSSHNVLLRFTRIAEDPAQPETTRTIARNLLAAARLAQAILTDEGRRNDYDADRKAGQSPTIADLVGQLHAEPRHGGGPIELAREKLEAGEHEAAAAAARRALFLEPDNPDVLAECAWVLWSARHVVPLDDDPEDFIHRALARHPGHERARLVRDHIANQRAAGHGTKSTIMGWLRSKS
jgi:hypothetical protein